MSVRGGEGVGGKYGWGGGIGCGVLVVVWLWGG